MFDEISLANAVEFVVDNRGKTVPIQETGFPLIATNCVSNENLYPEFNNVRYVSNEIYENWFRAHPLPDDILLTNKGSKNGAICLVPDPVNFCIAQDMVALRAKDGLVYPKYLFAVLRSNLVQNRIKELNVDSVIPHFKKTDFNKLFSPLPDFKKQMVIGDSYFNYCNKIELNHQTNQTLEKIAQALFKSWFVDFEPTRAKIVAKKRWQALHQIVESSSPTCYAGQLDSPNQNGSSLDGAMTQAAMVAISGKTEEQLKELDDAALQQLKTTAALFPDALVESELGEVPEGWGVTVLGEILEFNPKRILKKGTLAPYLDMKNVPTQGHLANDVYLREMASGTKFINGDTLLARITPCLENGKTAYVDFLEEEQVGWGSTEYIIMRPRNGRPMSLGYMIARLDSFRAKAIQTMTGTSGRQRANAQALSELSWISYPANILKVYDLIAGSYLVKAKANGDQNKSLSELRDNLLPKLLSGEISIDINQTIKEAVA